MEFVLSVALALILSYAVYRYLFSSPARKLNLPPGPKRLPIVGNLHQLGEKPHKSLTSLAKLHGPIISLKLGQITTIVVSSSKTAKQVLQTHDSVLSSRMIPDAIFVHGHEVVGLPWISPSPLWRTMRKICNNELFSGKALDSTIELRREKIQELSTRLQRVEGSSVDVGVEAFATSLNMLSNTVFSTDLADPASALATEFKEVTWNIMKEAGKPNLADYFPLLKRVDPMGIRRRMRALFGRILGLLGGMVDERKTTNGVHGDVLDTLLHIAETTKDINAHHIVHLLLVLFVAGTDTTATTIQWAMAELLRNPNVLSKARAELHEVIGRENSIEESDISRLPYLQAVIKETFRLHPAVPLLLPRKAEADVEIEGFLVPKDSQILVNVWAIGRDPELWTDSEEFRPERFIGSKIDVKGRSFELLPFGGGRRICPGLPLAMRVAHLILGTLIHRFEWTTCDGSIDIEDKFGITLEMANPLRATPTFISQ